MTNLLARLIRTAILLCGIVAILPLPSTAAPGFSIETWDTEKGLPQSVVFALAQTRDGYIWIGTLEGLARFDGQKFKVFDESNTAGLGSSRIVKVFEDKNNRLWIATMGSGVVIVADGKVTPVRLEPSASNTHVTDMFEDPSGHVWLRMFNGLLYRANGERGNPVLSGCGAVALEAPGTVWMGTSDGRLIGVGPITSNSAGALAVSYELPVPRLDHLCSSPRGGYWRFAGGRIEKWRGDKREKDLGPYPWTNSVPVSTACEDPDGNLIVGTLGNGVFWSGADGTWARVKDLPHPTVLSLLVDREGNLWVGSNGGGVAKVRRQTLAVLPETTGLTVQTVCEDTNRGLWLGYNGANRVDRYTTNGLERFIVGPDIADLPIRAVLASRSGTVWAGTYGAGLFRLDGQTFQRVNIPVASQRVTCLCEDSNGGLWAGTEGGLAFNTMGEWQPAATAPGSAGSKVTAIAVEPNGAYWVGTDGGGLGRFESNRFRVLATADGLPSDSVRALHLDSAGVLWVATSGGLGRYNGREWTRYTKAEGLPNNSVGYIVEDEAGFLWLGSTAGLLRVNRHALDAFAEVKSEFLLFRQYGKNDGLPSSECTFGSQPGPWRGADGVLWFPTIKGVASVDPRTIQKNTNAPPVVIEAVRIDGKPQGTEGLRASAVGQVVMSPGQERLEIDYSSLHFSAPGKGRFRYRLAPLESTWIERSGDSRSVSYTKLPHDTYHFEVNACNEDEQWNAHPATLTVVVQPPFWRKPWFRALAALVIVGLIASTVHYASTQRLQRQLAALRQQEALEKERARIARDLHDQLGANLTQVSLLAEMAEEDKAMPKEVEQHAKQIGQTARDTTHALDEIVWTVNPSNDTLDGLINYICKYAQDYLALAGLKYRLEVPPNLPHAPISPELRHNVFLVAKEAINNIVKHSKATAAWLRLQVEPNRFVLEIEDDGAGIQAGDENKGRSGLRNMRKRIEEIGGEFDLGKRAEGGTRIRLTAPFKR